MEPSGVSASADPPLVKNIADLPVLFNTLSTNKGYKLLLFIYIPLYYLDRARFELATSCVQSRRSPNWANGPFKKYEAFSPLPTHKQVRLRRKPDSFFLNLNALWAQVGSNHWPPRYQHGALPTELWALNSASPELIITHKLQIRREQIALQNNLKLTTSKLK